MDDEQVVSKITQNTRAVFFSYILGFRGFTENLLRFQRRETFY